MELGRIFIVCLLVAFVIVISVLHTSRFRIRASPRTQRLVPVSISGRSGESLVVDPSSEIEQKSSMELQVEQWRPDWYYEKDIGTLLDNRIKNARERCISFNNTKNAWSKEPHPEVTVSGCLEYCHTYKAAGTFWKRLLKNSRSSQLQSPLRVTTTRNPWHRLVSLYTHQMVSLSGTHLQQKINKFCLKDFKRRPSFREFIKNCVISQWRANNFNLHWMPTMEGCDICGGHVDLIVAVENIAEESSYILQKAGIKNAKSFVSQIRKKSIRTNEKQALSADYQSYYKNIDIADIRALQSLYAFDIYALGYPKTPFVDFQYS